MTDFVAVLGSGPAGLIAAHTATLKGAAVMIFSAPGASGKPEPSKLGGAQFLHQPIPMINQDEPDAVITYRTEGEPEGYHMKVYGGDPAVPFVSMSNVEDGATQHAWNLQRTYQKLWDLHAEYILPETVTAGWLQGMLDRHTFNMVISSVPAPVLCDNEHTFRMTRSHIANECILDSLPNNTIMYSGDKDRSWHRCSRLFGVGGTEWPETFRQQHLPIDTMTVRKPLKTNCNCFPDVVRVGRFGTWQKGILVNDSMRIVEEAMDALH